MNTTAFVIPIAIFVIFMFSATPVPAAQTYPLYKEDANINRFIRGLLRESRWKTDSSYRTGNSRWILNRQMVNSNEVNYERTTSIHYEG